MGVYNGKGGEKRRLGGTEIGGGGKFRGGCKSGDRGGGGVWTVSSWPWMGQVAVICECGNETSVSMRGIFLTS